MLRTIRSLAAATAVVLLVACGTPTAAPQTIELVVTDPPADTRRVEVQLGAEVTLRITTPTADRAHVHGYEIERDLAAGEPTDIVFEAAMAGTYEVESHVTDVIWLDLVIR
ncbi:cupredoxin domain-containing protein [Tessaracoccus sp. Z1128]